jgi:hypothetical protein
MRKELRNIISFAVVGLLPLLAACTSASTAATPAPTASPSLSPASVPSSPAVSPSASPAPSTTTAPDLKLLKVTPDKGRIGDLLNVTGDGLPPNQKVQLQWVTMDGGFDDKVFTETVEFYSRKFTPKRNTLGEATTDAQGHFSATLNAPNDYGEVHDIFAAMDGKDVAKGGFRILEEFTMTPSEGPVGTPITIKAKGIGWKDWESTWGVNWDNKYTGYISAVTTRGAATVVIRAAGPVGNHTLDIWHAGQTVPYLNWEESPQSYIPVFKYIFKVTDGSASMASTQDWPDSGPQVSSAPSARTTAVIPPATFAGTAAITPLAGTIFSKATLKASNLPPNSNVDLAFVTVRGSRTTGLGWGMQKISLGSAVVAADGTLTKDFNIPDDLGGWHTVTIEQGSQELAEAPVLIEPSLVALTPTRVKVGDNFEINIKGGGWTELDNIYAVDYDNSFIGFACAFNSNGDITLNLPASGEPGVHLIDLYPAVYQGHGKPPWLYDTPQLSSLQDHPGLSLGYKLPIFRLAIEVTQ